MAISGDFDLRQLTVVIGASPLTERRRRAAPRSGENLAKIQNRDKAEWRELQGPWTFGFLIASQMEPADTRTGAISARIAARSRCSRRPEK
jgi:hypothetical protein